jgi:hypothetical protein
MKPGPKPLQMRHKLWIATEYHKRCTVLGERLAHKKADALGRKIAAQTAEGREAINNLKSDALTEWRKIQADLQAVPVVLVRVRGCIEERRDPSKKRYVQERRADGRPWSKAIRGKRVKGKIPTLGAVIERLPRGAGRKIRESIAAAASRRFRMPVSERLVKKSWLWYLQAFRS